MFVNYREPELEELIEPEVSQQWQELATSLGMKGQLEAARLTKEDSTDKSPIPYMRLNKRWVKIFKTLCPSTSKYNEYKFSTIPLDGLAEIGLCKEKNYFEKLQIWYDDKEKDPLIVGINGSWSSEQVYLVGRFGDEVLPFEVLEQKAIKRLTDSFRNAVDRVSKTLENVVIDYLDKDEDPKLSVADGHATLYSW